MIPLTHTALGGRLVRRPEGWFARFGRREVPAPWVRDARMAGVVGATWDERMVGRRELAELLGVSPKTVDAWRRRPDFPPPVRVEGSGRADGRGGRRTPRWRLTDVLTWLAR